jgi:hypothetical protein
LNFDENILVERWALAHYIEDKPITAFKKIQALVSCSGPLPIILLGVLSSNQRGIFSDSINP